MEKVKNVFSGMLAGLVFFVLSFVILWWNEGNNAKNIATASYMQKNALQIESNTIQESNNGLLVALTGAAITDSILHDENIKMSKALVLKRTVKMYQWEEKKYEDSNGNKRYEYTKKWSERKINSNFFHESYHSNPDFPIETKSFYAESAKLGAFDLTMEQIKKITPEKEIYNLPKSQKYSIENGQYFSGTNIKMPAIGDILISYSYAPSGTNISLIGKQQSNHITSFNYKNRDNLVLFNGSLNKEGIIEKYKQENATLTMILRIVGWIVMFMGLRALISPIDETFGRIPILGIVVNRVSNFVILLISLALSLITIALAWFVYRPVISIIIIAIAICIIILIKQKYAEDK